MTARPDTKTLILDAAEKLFGDNGFEATSLRDITTAAEVNLAAVNYHFQSKDSLIDAVIARRIQPVNERRLALLDAAGPEATVEQILDAFLRPVFETDIASALPLLGRIMSNPDFFVDRLFQKHLAPVAQRFLEALRCALPEHTPLELTWRLYFSVGVMTHVLLWGPVLPRITNGLVDIRDRRALLDRSVRFLAAGFRAPACNS
jgi:AcrR family transcriptional regulator